MYTNHTQRIHYTVVGRTNSLHCEEFESFVRGMLTWGVEEMEETRMICRIF